MNKFIENKIFFISIFIFSFLRAQDASDTLTLSLGESIRMGQENGPLSTMARKAYENKKHHYKAFTAGFLPQLTLQADAPQFIRTINSITQPDGSSAFLLQRQAQSSLSLALMQRLPWTNTEISVYSRMNRLDNLETKSAVYRSSPLTLSVRQSLFSINTTAWSTELEYLSYQSSHREFVEAMEDAAIDITSKFFGFYLASMNVNNAQLNLAINDTLFVMSKGRFNVGKIAENDLLQSELAFLNARTQYESAIIEYDRALHNFRHAIGVTDERPIHVQPNETPVFIEVDPVKALAYALQYRSDVLNFEVQKITAERNVRQTESNNSFSMSVFANIGLNQKANTFGDAYINLLDQQEFSVQVQIPLYGFGSGSHAIESAEAERSRVESSVESQQFSFKQDILYQVQRFRQLQTQVALSGKADTVAQRRFDVARERFTIGKIDVPNLFLAQSEKDAAYRARIQTLSDYWTTLYRLRRLTLYDFPNNQPLVFVDEGK
ncbi:MAG: TolC family protein [Bacteroidota bacterium]